MVKFYVQIPHPHKKGGGNHFYKIRVITFQALKKTMKKKKKENDSL
jgi:hypothetical protein